jgi:tetratricopeptide (TPR) repeat protein
VRILALNHLAVRNAKRGADVKTASYWLDLHGQEIQWARPKLGEPTFTQLMSRHHRAMGFLPQLSGDREGVIREMDLCHQYAERMPHDTFEQCMAADELLFAALESRIKEALWLGDLDAAEQRARRLVELWPQDPQARDHLGQVLVEQERVEEALDAYFSSARIGAPGAEAAWFMAGQCYEALDLPERACDAYLTALRLDPLGISCLERLAEVADSVASPMLASWSRGRLADLHAQQSAVHNRPQLAAYQQYAGHLGGT